MLTVFIEAIIPPEWVRGVNRRPLKERGWSHKLGVVNQKKISS